MKRAIVASVLGIAAMSTAFAQSGHVLFSNYLVSPYNQVVWDASWPANGGQPVNDASVQLSLWYAMGDVTDEGALTQGAVFTVDPLITYQGGGYYSGKDLAIPGWASGNITVQLRAEGDTPDGTVDAVRSRSAMFSINNVVDSGLPANTAPESIGLTVFPIVPEPTTLALAGLGLAGLLVLRRKKA